MGLHITRGIGMNLKFLAGAAASFAVAISASSAALAQDKTLYVGMNGGPYEKTFTEAVFPDFEKANGVKIVVVPGTSTDILAKATASKDSTAAPKRSDDEAVKEIQRLKDELAKANEELDRIKKRLAAPKP